MRLLRVAVLALALAGASVGVLSQDKPAQFERREFLVYFPKQQAVVTPAADAVVGVASEYALQALGARVGIRVTGHTDSAESDALNLSLRRANAAAEALFHHGLPDSVLLTVRGVGASQLSVPTGPGVSEALNRTVSIEILPIK